MKKTWRETKIASSYGGFELPRVNYNKCKTEIQGKSILIRVSTKFELSGVDCSVFLPRNYRLIVAPRKFHFL